MVTCLLLCVLQLAAPDNLEQQFQALEGDSVDDDLAKMKAGRLKSGNGSKAQLPEGRPYDQVFKKDAIDEVQRLVHVMCCMSRHLIGVPVKQCRDMYVLSDIIAGCEGFC